MKAFIIVLMALFLGEECFSQREPKFIIAFIDNSISYQQYFDSSKDICKRIILSMHTGDKAILKKITGKSFVDERDDIILEIPRHKTTMDLRAMRETKLRKKKALKEIEQLRFAKSRTTDISGSLHLASELFSNSNYDKKILLIFTDLEETVETDAGYPNLKDIEVYAINIPMKGDVKKHKKIIEHWKKYFKAAGCKSFNLISAVESKTFSLE